MDTQKLGVTLADYSENVDLTVLVNRGWLKFDPQAVTVNHQGTGPLAPPNLAPSVPGASTVTYYVVARNTYGTGPDGKSGRRTSASASVSVGSANPISGTNSITISGNLPAQHNWQTIEIIRSVGGPSQGLIASIPIAGLTSFSFTDTGLPSQSYVAPLRNETADILVGGFLGIGTLTPQQAFEVNGGSRFDVAGNGIELVQLNPSTWQVQPVGLTTTLNFTPDITMGGSLSVSGALTAASLTATEFSLSGTTTLTSTAIFDASAAALVKVPVNATVLTQTGGIRLNTGDSTLRFYDGTTERQVITALQAQTLNNKTLASPVVSGANQTGAGVLGYSSGLLQVGDGSATRTLVSTDQAQTLSNKTIASATLSGTTNMTGSVAASASFASTSTIQASFDGAAVIASPGDLGSRRGVNQGLVFLGNLTHYLTFDGTNYQMPNGALYVNAAQVPTVSNAATFTSGPYTSDWFRVQTNGQGLYSQVSGQGITFSSGDLGPKFFSGTFNGELIQSRNRHDGQYRIGTNGGVTIDMSQYDGYAFNTSSGVTLPSISAYYGRTLFVKNMTGANATVGVSDSNGIYDNTWRNPITLLPGDSLTLYASPQYSGWLVI